LITGGMGWIYQGVLGALGHCYIRACTPAEAAACGGGAGGPGGCYVGIVGANPPPPGAAAPFLVGGTLNHCGPFGGGPLHGHVKAIMALILAGGNNYQLSSTAVESEVASPNEEDLDPSLQSGKRSQEVEVASSSQTQFYDSPLAQRIYCLVGIFVSATMLYTLFSKGSIKADDYEPLTAEEVA